MESFSAALCLLLLAVVVVPAYIFLHGKACARSEHLVRKAEEGDRASMQELIRLDLECCGGVVLVAKDSRHYEYLRVVDSAGYQHPCRYRSSSFPSREFFELYRHELCRLDRDDQRVQALIQKIDHYKEPYRG